MLYIRDLLLRESKVKIYLMRLSNAKMFLSILLTVNIAADMQVYYLLQKKMDCIYIALF